MRRVARWFLVLVLALDVGFVTLMLTGSTTQIRAQDSAADTEVELADPAMPVQSRWTREALQLLGKELSSRANELDRRQLELEEAARSIEVLRRATIGDADGAGAGSSATTAATQLPASTTRPGMEAAARQELFTRLRKTYENMEPDTAAAALSQLALLDKGAVIELMLGWNPRVAGAVLDSLTLSDPTLAADLSYGIWLRSGKNQPDEDSAP